MAFIETQFPVGIAYGSSGGPEFNTSVIGLDNGSEQRLVRWPVGRHRYDASSGIKTRTDYYTVLSMFQACNGMGHGFRWKDYSDYKTADTVTHTDCELVDANGDADVGDGTTDEFYLAKKYTFGSTTVYRPLTKPIAATVKIGVDGVLQTVTTHYTVDSTTGKITFVTPPGNTLAVTGGCEFDVPCRFDSDTWAGRVVNIKQDGCTELLIDFEIQILEIKP